MAKTSKGMILNSQNKLQSDLQFVLIDIDDKDSMSLIRSVDQNSIFIDAVSKRTNWIRSSLDQLGLKAGCYLISDLRDQTNVNIVSLINAFSPIRQYGYQVGIIADINQLPSLDDLIKNQVYLINSGKSNQKQDALLQNNEIDDCSGKLSKGMSVAWQRDYTNVDISIDRAGYVGMGQDTLLKGGKGFGYSTNGKDFNTVISPKGIIFRRADAERMWRLLRPKEINDIDMTVNDRVKKMVDSATAEIPQAVSNANEAVKKADSAVANSKVNSDAIKAMQSAASEAKSDAQNATNIANAMKSSVTDQLKNLDSTSKELDNARSEMTQYAKTAQDQGKDIADLKKSTAEITADVANTKGDVAELKINASATAVMASNNKSDITQLQVTASNASIDLQNAKSDIASFNATANKINTSIKDQDNRISTVEQTAKDIRATIGNQQNDINTIKQDATGMKETITNNQKQLTEINTSVDGLSTKVAGAVGKDFVESSIKQANDKINESITSINGNIQNITADLNGVQATVKNKADISQVTQLSNVIASKVSQDDYNTEISQLSNDINLRVSKGDLISQINLEAGKELFQAKKIYLDADDVIFGDKSKAFIPDAAITNVTADKISAGTIKGVNLLINNGTDTTTVNNSGITNAGLAPNQKDHYTVTRIDNGVVKFGNVSPNDVKNKTSDNLFMDPEGLTKDWTVKGKIDQQNLYDTKYSVAQLDKQDVISQSIQDSVAKQKGVKLAVSFYAKADNDGDNLLLSYNKSQASQKLGTDYQKYSYTITNNADFDSITIAFSGNNDNKGAIYVTEPTVTRQLTDSELAEKAIDNISQSYDSSIFGNDGNLLESSKGTITIHAGDLLNDKSFWTSDGTWISKSIPPAEIKLNPNKNGSGAVTIQASGSVIDMNASSVSIFSSLGDPAKGQGVQIEGLGIGGNTIWSDDDFFSIGSQRTGTYTYINIKGINYLSTLSSKTRIKRLDRKEALSTIMRDDIYTYLYKSDVQLGLTKRHASLVIDDENDVAQYRAPEEFISESGNARDDGTQLGYLIAAVQYQQEEIEELKNKLEEK
ncbi:hypothetical protein [uncultured Limosilactobacillus sp.]|uniref:hypothetical protein n=1 Tax=uncultured Limosilactobacillus sp. TaxID=2837629 RepID=UPI00258AC7DA|nr:hypothetical protein [uncultured Limosilactobacillus sp.]